MPNLIVTSELGSKLIPATVTELPATPEVGSSTIIGVVEVVTVTVFEAKLAAIVSPAERQ